MEISCSKVLREPKFHKKPYHRIMTETNRLNIGLANKGKKRTIKFKQRQSELHKGIPHTEEHNRKIGLSHKGKHIGGHRKGEYHCTPETARKIGLGNKGKVRTEEFKEALRNREVSSETRMKTSHTLLLDKEGLIVRNTGERNPNWKGGKSFELYPEEFNYELKAKIRARDANTCQLCGKIETRTCFSVHHIDYNKQNNSDDNLITLCKKCNGKVNFNRAYWQAYFIPLVYERKLSEHIIFTN